MNGDNDLKGSVRRRTEWTPALVVVVLGTLMGGIHAYIGATTGSVQ